MPLGSAARLCGINPLTYERWIIKGKKGIQPFTAFVAAFEEAED